MPFSTTEANAILNSMIHGTSISGKSQVYIGLLTNDPEADGGKCNEIPSGTDTYHRVLIAKGASSNLPALMGDAANRAIQNTAQITWTKATAQWPEVKGIALYTAETDGTPFYYAKVPTPFTVDPGEVALFEAEAFKISMLTTDTAIN